jgi:PTH1 family peptidyl-tRNA hydrolase
MKLIIGLGNPEKRYDDTRHNVGFCMLDAIARAHSASFQDRPKFKSQIAELVIGDEKVLLIKPTTYYNLTGEAMRLVMDFYKVSPEDILIIHDELALPFGTIRTRQGGSDAGNNGVKSINEHGGMTTSRIRIGVWNELRDRMDDAAFVLSTFSKSEREALTTLEPTILTLATQFSNNELMTTTHRVAR